MYMFTHFSTLCVGFVLLCSTPSIGQSPMTILNCPSEASTFQESDSNKNQVWNTFSTTTAEAEVELALAISSNSAVHVAFTLMLDLDGDSEQETRIDSRALPAAGMIPFNNEFSFGENVAFGTPSKPYSFAVQQSQEGATAVARIVFQNGNTTEKLVLPQGNHAILWSVTNAAGESASCFKSVKVKAGKQVSNDAELSLDKSTIKTDSFE